MRIEIKRFEHDTWAGNRGVVFVDGVHYGFSMEQKKLMNRPFVSRIPAGKYKAIKVYSKKRGWFWLLQDVPGRTEIILFHPGSYVHNFQGCIGLGDRLFKNKVTGKRMILNTRKMCKKFMETTAFVDEIKVVIK